MTTKLTKSYLKKGFTLIEMIVVMAIIAILAAILIPLLSKYMSDAVITAGNANARSGFNSGALWYANNDPHTLGSRYFVTMDKNKSCFVLVADPVGMYEAGTAEAAREKGPLLEYFANLKSGRIEVYVNDTDKEVVACIYKVDVTPSSGYTQLGLPTDRNLWKKNKDYFVYPDSFDFYSRVTL